MKQLSFFIFLPLLSACILCGCGRSDMQSGISVGKCHIYGTIEGLPHTGLYKVEVYDSWNRFETVSKSAVRDGQFSLHADVSQLTHVCLYCVNRLHRSESYQIRDFILEPGEIEINADIADEASVFSLVSGTPTNNLLRELQSKCSGQETVVRDSIVSEFMGSTPPEEAVLFIIENKYFNPQTALQIFNTLSIRLQEAQYATRSVRENLEKDACSDEVFTIGKQYREIIGISPDGNDCRLSDYIGRSQYTLVDYWGTWCGGCVKSLPEIASLVEKDTLDKLTVVGVNVQEGMRGENMNKFLTDHGVTWNIIIDQNDSVDYVSFVPFLALYDQNGKLLLSGYSDKVLLEIEGLL